MSNFQTFLGEIYFCILFCTGCLYVCRGVEVSSQNVSATSLGAYTGEIAAEQLVDMGIPWTIIGHSERRTYYGDTNDVVKTKVSVALGKNLKVIACFGETLEQSNPPTHSHTLPQKEKKQWKESPL